MSAPYGYSAEREVLTYAYLFRTAEECYKRAKATPEGSFFQIMSSLTFAAFTMEAYLNHIGPLVIPFWGEIDRIKTLGKLKAIHFQLKLSYYPSKRPIQTVVQLFKFRNFLAHGRTESVKGSGTLEEPKVPPGKILVETKWEQFCNENEAERALEDVRAVAGQLNKAAGLKGNPFLVISTSNYVIFPGNAQQQVPADGLASRGRG